MSDEGAAMNERWRVGTKLGRTVYIGDRLVGMMDTEALARQVVEAVNGTPTVASHDIEVEYYDRMDGFGLIAKGFGVQMTHTPTGFSTACHGERSQLMNKVVCMNEITAALRAGVPSVNREG